MEDDCDDEMLSAIEGLSSTRPCCSKSDDFHTFGPIFLEKGFEREYRLVPIPRARYDFACASLVFVCILLVHLLVMPRSACDGGDGQAHWGDRGGDYGRTQQKLARLAGRNQGLQLQVPHHWSRGMAPELEFLALPCSSVSCQVLLSGWSWP